MGKKETSKVVIVQRFGHRSAYVTNTDYDIKCGDYLIAETVDGDEVVRAISDCMNVESDKLTKIIDAPQATSRIKHKLELRVDLGFNDNKLP